MKIFIPACAIIAVLFISCSTGSSNDPAPATLSYNVPMLPTALSADGSVVVSRTAVALDEANWPSEYGSFVVVPEIGGNYNPFVKNCIAAVNELKSTPSAWTNFSETGSPFTQKATIASNPPVNNAKSDIIIRANADFSEYEVFYCAASELSTWYFRVKFTAAYTHSILLILGTNAAEGSTTPGDGRDSIELIQTNDRLYTKCVRIHDKSTNPILQHFVAISDLSSANTNTTGIRKSEVKTGTSSYDFDSAKFATALEYNDATQPAGNYIYGFFDNARYFVSKSDADSAHAGFISQNDSLLTGMFDYGLNTKKVSELSIDGVNGTGGIALPDDWPVSYLK